MGPFKYFLEYKNAVVVYIYQIKKRHLPLTFTLKPHLFGQTEFRIGAIPNKPKFHRVFTFFRELMRKLSKAPSHNAPITVLLCFCGSILKSFSQNMIKVRSILKNVLCCFVKELTFYYWE